MTAETRRNILRYGIAVDLVILATGIGLVWPDAPVLLAVAYTVAVMLAVWKGGWKGGVTALLLSIAALAYFFAPVFPPARLVGVAAVAAGMGALVLPTHGRRGTRSSAIPMPAAPVAQPEPERERTPEPEAEPNVVAFEREFAERPLMREVVEPLEPDPRAVPAPKPAKAARRRKREHEQRERREREAREAQEREQAERVARAERQREEAERVARDEHERQEAERVAREQWEREEAERVAREQWEREEAERVAREQREREEAERVAREQREREEAARVAREQREREEAERVAREQREREEAERVAREQREREEAERIAREQRDRELAEQRQREQQARRAAAEALRLAEEERRAAETRAEEARRAAQETLTAAETARREAEHRAAHDREEAARIERDAREKLEAEKRAAEERLAAEREAIRVELEKKLAAEREALEKTHPKAPAPAPAGPVSSLIGTLTGWFKRPAAKSVNLATKKIASNGRKPPPPPPSASSTATRRPVATRDRHPRLLLLERRRGTADTISPKLKHKGVDVAVVERWVDAVDELFRFRPDAILVDTDHPDFDTAYRTITEQNPKLPVVLTGRSAAGFTALPHVRYASFAVRPYDADELSRLAQQAMHHPEKLLQQQTLSRGGAQPKPPSTPNLTLAPKPVDATPAPAPSRPVAVPNPPAEARAPASAPKLAAPMVVAVKPPTDDEYEVMCVSCRTPFEALDADWCSCLTKERTLVCTNCLTCFCKAAPAYKEKFWVEAPPRLFERKTAEARRQQSGLAMNPGVEEVKRPLVLCVEDDEEIQAVVQRVCSNLGYGFIYATNGQDGLQLARLYRPNLILSDAFMPKLDGREMCRLLKEEPTGADCRMIIMTGLYTDTKYRSEAIKRFHVDDYVAKPVAITDLINLLQKHLEGVAGLPAPDDLYEQHRREVEEQDEPAGHDDEMESGIALADLLTAEMEAEEVEVPATPAAKPAARTRSDAYAVACVNCSQSFDATKAEWCSCVGRDQTLACTHCGGCFCKAPASYKERFWMDAPPSLFERKMIGSKRNLGARSNPLREEVKRPLILLVEDDENVQLIVKTVVTSMGYGFIAGANGQEGLSLAREYNPELILSDAFMPKLDGREMCRLLKEDPATARSKAIIMTGLYTDRKYRNEALDYFKVDDYVAKPLAVDDLIKLFKKHLPLEVQAAS